MKTQSPKINKNHWFLQCSRTCGDWDFRFYSYPNLHLTRFSFCLENDEKWGPRGLEILWKPIMSTKSFPKEKQKSSRVPQEGSRTPLWGPKMSPERAQDVSRTPPRRLQIASWARLLLISPSGPQKVRLNGLQKRFKTPQERTYERGNLDKQTERKKTARLTEKQSDRQTMNRQIRGQTGRQTYRKR